MKYLSAQKEVEPLKPTPAMAIADDRKFFKIIEFTLKR